MRASDKQHLKEMIYDMPSGSTVQALTGGDDTITKPTGARGCIIAPIESNTATIALKGAGGDTGVTLHPRIPTVLNIDDSDASFILNASGATTVNIRWFNEQ